MKRGNSMRTTFPLTSSPADVGGGSMINVTKRNDGSPMTTSGMTAKRLAGPLLLLTLSLALSLCFGTAAQAACHVVTPNGAGSKDGSTWGNAFAWMPPTLLRGDSYYIATGTYHRYRFNTPESGTTVITIKKAAPTDHCTETGWQTGFGVGQAVWADNSGAPTWEFSDNGYWIIDGQYRTNSKSGHGFRINWGTK